MRSKATTKTTETRSDSGDQPALNPHFKRQLPDIINDLCSVLNLTEPQLEEARNRVAEIRDYLDFEIQKAQLALDKDAWENRLPPGKKERDKDWLERLVALRDELTSENVMASTVFLNRLQQTLAETFLHHGGDAAATCAACHSD